MRLFLAVKNVSCFRAPEGEGLRAHIAGIRLLSTMDSLVLFQIPKTENYFHIVYNHKDFPNSLQLYIIDSIRNIGNRISLNSKIEYSKNPNFHVHSDLLLYAINFVYSGRVTGRIKCW